MNNMFNEVDQLTANLSSWNTANVTDMQFMFRRANGMNHNIGGWNVSKVTNMYSMFYQNTGFNQNISGWNVSAVTNCGTFRGYPGNYTLSCSNSPALPASCTGC
jgi:surface protein